MDKYENKDKKFRTISKEELIFIHKLLGAMFYSLSE